MGELHTVLWRGKGVEQAPPPNAAGRRSARPWGQHGCGLNVQMRPPEGVASPTDLM